MHKGAKKKKVKAVTLSQLIRDQTHTFHSQIIATCNIKEIGTQNRISRGTAGENTKRRNQKCLFSPSSMLGVKNKYAAPEFHKLMLMNKNSTFTESDERLSIIESVTFFTLGQAALGRHWNEMLVIMEFKQQIMQMHRAPSDLRFTPKIRSANFANFLNWQNSCPGG